MVDDEPDAERVVDADVVRPEALHPALQLHDRDVLPGPLQGSGARVTVGGNDEQPVCLALDERLDATCLFGGISMRLGDEQLQAFAPQAALDRLHELGVVRVADPREGHRDAASRLHA